MLHFKVNIVFTLFFMLTVQTEQAKILVVLPSPLYSHQKAFRPLWTALSERGHHITLITTNPTNLEEGNTLWTNSTTRDNSTRENLGKLGHKPVADQNYERGSIRQIDVSNIYNVFKEYNYYELFENADIKPWNQFSNSLYLMYACTEELLGNPEVNSLIVNDTETFDLLMVEYLNPVVFAFTYRFQVPFIGFLSLDAHYMGHDAMGDQTHPVLYPDVNISAYGELTFWERVESCLVDFFTRLFFYFAKSNAEYLAKKYFGDRYNGFTDQANELDMYFIITNPLFIGVRPTVPGVLYLSGMDHKQSGKPLPQCLQSYLDKASQGVVYLSLGSTLPSKYLSSHLKQTILETFAELPYEFLWKYEDEELPGRTPNVLIMSWLPQADVLKHPNLKVFITQGGLQSIEEAIYNHVPMIGAPIFGDQGYNVKRIVARGLGLSVDLKSLTKEHFKSAILEVAENIKYKENIRELATLSLDKPFSSLEDAVWWTEYVIRHKGAKHLKGPAARVPIYQYFLLDVIGFVISVILIILCVFYKLIKVTLNSCRKVVKEFKKD